MENNIKIENRPEVGRDLIYLASPYSNPDPLIMRLRFEQAMYATAVLLREGYIVFSPILNSHPIAEIHELPKDWDYWKTVDEVFISRCDELWILMLDGWRESVGVGEEILIAKNLGITIRYINVDGTNLSFLNSETPTTDFLTTERSLRDELSDWLKNKRRPVDKARLSV